MLWRVVKKGECGKSKMMWMFKEIMRAVERVDAFEYLGTTINSIEKVDQKIVNTTKKGMSACYQTKNVIIWTNEMSTKTKLQLYYSVIVKITYETEPSTSRWKTSALEYIWASGSKEDKSWSRDTFINKNNNEGPNPRLSSKLGSSSSEF